MLSASGSGSARELVPVLYDPVQHFIDRQLASVWREHQLMKKQTRGREIKIKEQFPATNRIEDEMLYALDAKYFGSSRVDELMSYYAGEGCYTQTDIGKIIGRSQSWVSKRIHTLSAEMCAHA